MPKPRPTARQKLERAHPSHGVPFEIPKGSKGPLKSGTMIVPRPLDVDAEMRTARKGRIITIGEIRNRLAKAAKVDHCCPLTTGIFARLAAEAAEEDAAAGKSRITPWWRTVRDDGKLIDKFPGKGALQAQRLKAEGIKVLPGRGKQPPRIADHTAKPGKASTT